jgi:hypothetical protein
MTNARIHQKIERTAEHQRELEEIRHRFQKEKPGLDELLASGDAAEVVSQGEYIDSLVKRADSRSSKADSHPPR